MHSGFVRGASLLTWLFRDIGVSSGTNAAEERLFYIRIRGWRRGAARAVPPIPGSMVLQMSERGRTLE